MFFEKIPLAQLRCSLSLRIALLSYVYTLVVILLATRQYSLRNGVVVVIVCWK